MGEQRATEGGAAVKASSNSPCVGARSMLAAALFWLVTGFTPVDAASPVASREDAGPAAALRAQHDALRSKLASNPFNRPLVLESIQTSDAVKGEIHAVVPSAFGKVSEALAGPQGWCDVLFLHLNTKFCRISRGPKGPTLLMNVGKKHDQPLEDSFRLEFEWLPAERKADYLRTRLSADSGPLSTHDYRITLAAVALQDGRTFLHLSYSYGFGMSGKLAMQAYLSTIGRAKVGFTVTGREANGQPVFVDGMRGLVERNTMRYYLAIEAYLGALEVPERAQFEKRINDWFSAVERYPRQLHEIEQAEYLTMKRREYRRQQQGE